MIEKSNMSLFGTTDRTTNNSKWEVVPKC
jgi:hypothetical protein